MALCLSTRVRSSMGTHGNITNLICPLSWRQLNEKTEGGKMNQEVKGPRLHTNEDYLIEEVNSNDEVIVVETLVGWRDLESWNGSKNY